jgi:hypothetical protein
LLRPVKKGGPISLHEEFPWEELGSIPPGKLKKIVGPLGERFIEDYRIALIVS